MRIQQFCRAKLTTVSAWCVEDPRRLMVIVVATMMLMTAIALAAGLTSPAIQIGPVGGGGSGGSG